ncbi:MAG TPA: hypothetical protein VFH61_02130, partial [Thermoleophilia bacterium]|nr:hypothetical protein [Thermoleophilia bacterium]
NARRRTDYAAILLLSASTLCVSAPTRADDAAVPLEAGEAAPFAGQLLTPELALKLGMGLEGCRERSKLQLEHAREMCRVRSAYEVADRKIREGALADKVTLLTAELDRALLDGQTPWWEEPGFVTPVAFGAGLVVSAALVFGAVWAAGQLGISFRQENP